MEYYSEYYNDIMKFASKWMELEKIILNMVSQTQRENNSVESQMVISC